MAGAIQSIPDGVARFRLRLRVYSGASQEWDPANPMRPQMELRDNHASERRLVITGAIIATAAMAMLSFQFARKFGWFGHSPAFFWMDIFAELVVLVTIILGGAFTLREMDSRRRMALGAFEARNQVEVLFAMTDMLQSALCHADANAVLRSTAIQLLPDMGGMLYVFNNSGDRLERSIQWNLPDSQLPREYFAPEDCWALKRGKRHINHPGGEALCCRHFDQEACALELPMIARGEVLGLLVLQAQGENAADRLQSAEGVASALADAMSLALGNIGLREKLRTQALRDALTGLYNRRYMEDLLDRYAGLAERNQSSLSLIMIDLDHFKRLNDEHGHALGDTVLTAVSAVLQGGVRPCDIACRYGGEELAIVLPDCELAEAATKAEMLRARIEQLSENYGVRVTASFGVATIPASSAKVADLLSAADDALYRAKGEGRNRVVTAPVRQFHPPRVAAA